MCERFLCGLLKMFQGCDIFVCIVHEVVLAIGRQSSSALNVIGLQKSTECVCAIIIILLKQFLYSGISLCVLGDFMTT